MNEDKNKSKKIFGWVMYDFANSGYATTILAAVLPIYFANIVPEDGASFSVLGFEILLKASTLWAYTLSFSMLIVAVTSPVLGAIADFSGAKKKLLALYCYVGAFFTSLLYFVEYGDYLLAAGIFLVANIGFAGGNVFYNAFLPELAEEDEIDWLSGKGFAYGYLGGGILLIINLIMIQKFQLFGFSDKAMGTRMSFLSVGIWWAIFSIPTFALLREKKGSPLPEGKSYLSLGYGTLIQTFREIRRFRELTKFLVAFLIYNDGIQTVIAMATIFGKTELGLGEGTLIGALLLTQFIALPGSLLFGKIAQRINAKNAIIITLVVWCGVVIYAYFLQTDFEFWILAAIVGLVLGGSQAISRSLYATFVPKKNSAEFFGFFAISNKFASILGPFMFAVTSQIFGNTRVSIVSLITFFIIGLLILLRVDIAGGRAVAKLAVREDYQR